METLFRLLGSVGFCKRAARFQDKLWGRPAVTSVVVDRLSTRGAEPCPRQTHTVLLNSLIIQDVWTHEASNHLKSL